MVATPARMRRAELPRLLAGLLLVCAGCGPLGPVPGGRLSGQLVSTPMTDWTFLDDHWTIELETRPDDPYSVTIWCVSLGSRLYVGAGSPTRRWGHALLQDPSARVRVDGSVYPRSAVRVTDHSEIEAYLIALSRKYPGADASLQDFLPVDGEAGAILFRLDPPSAP